MIVRRLSILAIALLAIGCSSHSVAPGPTAISPQVVQNQPLPAPNWTWVDIPFVNGKKPIPFALVSDGKSKMWFIDQASQLGSVTMSQKVTTYPLNLVPTALAYGPDGNLWITGTENSYTKSVVAKVTTTGTELDYVVDGGGAESSAGIVVGPDGALWFTIGGQNARGIGRITTAGVYSFFPFPSTDPIGIAVGSDKNLWAADFDGAIDKVTTAGIETVYPTQSAPVVISSGPDGELYFTTYSSEFGRMATDGSVTYFGLLNLWQMANGPDKLLWAGDLETFNPANSTFKHVSQYPHGGSFYALAVGPDRNIWVSSAESIGTYVRLAMAVSPTSLTISAPGQTGTLSVTESNYHGTWTATTSSKSIATVVESSPGVFTVTAVGAGKCTITISDTTHNFAHVSVVVQ